MKKIKKKKYRFIGISFVLKRLFYNNLISFLFKEIMSGSKGLKKLHNHGYGKAGETGKPFPPPGGFYVQWSTTPTPEQGGYERCTSSKY